MNPADLPTRDRDLPFETELAKGVVPFKDILAIYGMVRQRVEWASRELQRISPGLLFQIELQWICVNISRAKSFFGAPLVGRVSA